MMSEGLIPVKTSWLGGFFQTSPPGLAEIVNEDDILGS